MTKIERKQAVRSLVSSFMDANATFIGMVIGSMVSLVTDNLTFWPFACFLSFGLLGTTLLALIANNVLKNK